MGTESEIKPDANESVSPPVQRVDESSVFGKFRTLATMTTTPNEASGTSMAANFCCQTRCAERVGSLTWKVESLAKERMYRNATRVWTSPEFPVSGPGCERLFALQIKTGTDTSPEEGFVGLFLNYVKGPLDCSALCGFWFNNRSNMIPNQKSQLFRFTSFGRSCGYEKFITRKVLLDQNSQLIHNNEVSVSCAVIVFEEPQVSKLYSLPQRAENVHSNCSSLSEEWKSFYDQKLNADIALKVGREQFMAHKAVLMCRSSVFRAMLSHNMCEKISDVVLVEDVDADVFEQLLRYMYTNDFNRQSIHLVARLMVAADKYDMQSLKSRCSDYLCDSVKLDNVLQILKFTELCSSVEIDKTCLSIVNQELFPSTCVLDCMKKVMDLPQVLDLLKKRFVQVDRPNEQNKRHCPESRGVSGTAPALPAVVAGRT